MQNVITPTAAKWGIVKATDVIGEAVMNSQDEELGKIHELVIDAKDGRVSYAVLSAGGFLGIGSKLLAIPWNAFELAGPENSLVLNVEKEKLKAAPGFDEATKWPDLADKTRGGEIHAYYGCKPYWKP